MWSQFVIVRFSMELKTKWNIIFFTVIALMFSVCILVNIIHSSESVCRRNGLNYLKWVHITNRKKAEFSVSFNKLKIKKNVCNSLCVPVIFMLDWTQLQNNISSISVYICSLLYFDEFMPEMQCKRFIKRFAPEHKQQLENMNSMLLLSSFLCF